MNTSRMRLWFHFLAIAACLALTNVGSSARAADASPWISDENSGVRLIAGSAKDPAALRAGVEVKLAPGWKTYWRYPGDAGVPPRFDFAQSQNVKSVALSWPAPQRFSDGGGTSIGYKDSVIWPIRVVPEIAGQPVRLHLNVAYAICEKLCVPVEATTELALTGDPSSHDAALKAAEERVPKPAPLGQGLPGIQSVTRGGSARQPRVTVDVAAPAGQPIDLFVEGPTPDWALPLPEAAPAVEGSRRFTFDLDGLPPGAKSEGAELRFTLVSPARAIEVTTHLD